MGSGGIDSDWYTHSHTHSIYQPDSLTALGKSSVTQLATRTWTTQALKKIKNQGQHDSLSALGQLKSKLQQQSSSLFWCRSILFGSTGHPVQLQQQWITNLLLFCCWSILFGNTGHPVWKNSVWKYGPSGLENLRRGLNHKKPWKTTWANG